MSNRTIHKSVKWFAICCAVFTVLFFGFWLVIHPFVATLFLRSVEHKGVDIYTSEKYLTYHCGEAFQQEIVEFGFIEECTPTGFYHVDNWKWDNLFYGKICDIFCLELDTGDNYELIKTTVQTKQQKTLPEENWEISLLTPPSFDRRYTNYFFVATNDETRSVRYLLIVDYRGDITYDFRSTFHHYAGIRWE